MIFPWLPFRVLAAALIIHPFFWIDVTVTTVRRAHEPTREHDENCGAQSCGNEIGPTPQMARCIACYRGRSLSQIHMCSPYRLSSTGPACDCQNGTPLAIDTPHLALLRYIVSVALYSDSEIHPVTPAVPSYKVGTTLTSDFVSHLLLLSILLTASPGKGPDRSALWPELLVNWKPRSARQVRDGGEYG